MLEKDVKKLLEEGIKEGVFPSAAAGISSGIGEERKKIISYCGNAVLYPEERKLEKNNFFDLASLTKPFATTLAILCLIKKNKICVDEKLPHLLDKKIKGEKAKITVKQLLSHSSGLPAHRDYFKILKDTAANKKGELIEKLILTEELEFSPGSRGLYSDLGFMLLGRIIEKKSGRPLNYFVMEEVIRPLGLEKVILYPMFEDRKRYRETDFVATENCPWRGKVLCGEVHDDNCYTMAGTAGHSGLFGTIEGVTTLAGFILDMWKGVARHPNIEKKTLIKFLTRQRKPPGNTWGLGFDTPASTGSSSGKYFSARSMGHLGFTGTSFWIDPDKDAVVVLLTNRVHPTRENSKIKQFRPYFHDRVMVKNFPPIK